LRALLLQAFYTVRSERQLMEQLDYNPLFRSFVGLSADDPVSDATVFCRNRDRLLDGDIAAKFLAGVLNLQLFILLWGRRGTMRVDRIYRLYREEGVAVRAYADYLTNRPSRSVTRALRAPPGCSHPAEGRIRAHSTA
jgi:Transposase domain (DUF772)